MKKVFLILELNTWSEPATWDVYKAFDNEKARDAFYYKDWPKNAGRYMCQDLEISK